MNRVYEWAIRLNDLVSPTLQRVSQHYSGTVSRMQRLTSKFTSMFKGASQSVDELRKKLDALKGRRDLMVDTRQIRQANREIQQLEGRLDRLQNAGRRGGSSSGSGGWLAGLARGALPALGVAGLLAGGASFAKMGMDREQTKVAFEQFVGKEGVNPMMKQLNRFADVTPYSNEDVYGAGRTLLSAKVDPRILNTTMTQIGNMAAVSQKDFGEMAAAYAKIKQKGFMDSGELHQEFGGTAVMDQLKKDLGVNGEQLFKMAEQRKIRFSDLQTAVENLSEKGGLYEGGLDKLSQTAGGKWSTFLGTLQNKATEWAEKLNPILGKAFDFGIDLLAKIDPLLEKLAPYFTKLWDAVEPLRDLFGDLWALVGRLFTQLVSLTGGGSGLKIVFDLLASAIWVASTAVKYAGDLVIWIVEGPLKWLAIAIGGITVAWQLFNIVAAMNPFTLIITAIGLVATGIKYAWDNIDGFRYAIIRMWEVAKSVFGSLGSAWEALKNGDFSGLKSALAQGWNDGLANANKAIAADKAARSIAAKQSATKKPGMASAGMAGASKSGSAGDKAGLSATTGGTKSTNITINLKSLLEGGVHINASGVQEGIGNMEALITDALLRVLNSANSMATT